MIYFYVIWFALITKNILVPAFDACWEVIGLSDRFIVWASRSAGGGACLVTQYVAARSPAGQAPAAATIRVPAQVSSRHRQGRRNRTHAGARQGAEKGGEQELPGFSSFTKLFVAVYVFLEAFFGRGLPKKPPGDASDAFDFASGRLLTSGLQWLKVTRSRLPHRSAARHGRIHI